MVGWYLINLLGPLFYSQTGAAKTAEKRLQLIFWLYDFLVFLQFIFWFYDFLITLMVYMVDFVC